MKYIIDTCIFNKIAESKLDKKNLPDGEFYATHIQLDEINNTPDKYKEKRMQLLLHFIENTKELVPTSAAVWDISRSDYSKLSDVGLYQKLKQELDAKNKNKSNNAQDCLIAGTAIDNGLVLFTADSDLKEVAENNGCEVLFFKE